MKFYVEEIIGTVNKQEKIKNKDETFEIFCCLVINTGEYCKDTLQGLVDTVKNYLDSPFKDKVNYDDEEELFIDLLNKGIDSCVAFADQKMDVSF
mmetsp:Transcript_30498/g.27741  ORF Transcript_30498/g.27741 Transcript_30498/m.27741 type:complete len:95 (+) Transcript_30498:623-907(+)